MSRRHCQSEEVDWDMAGESCSEVKTAPGTRSCPGSAPESWRLARSSHTPGWFGCSQAQPGTAGRICKPMINSGQSPSLLSPGSQGWGVGNWAAAIGAVAAAAAAGEA